jgi:diaminopimelate decarboxylase
MTEVYEKPVITKLQNSFMNKFSQSGLGVQRVREAIEGVSIDELTENFGSPLFVYSERALRRKVRQVRNAFATRYQNVVFGWSYKTNYLKAVCAIMHQEGSIAEVVSDMEYEKARQLGISGEDIIFNGPHKSSEALERAVLEGAMINVDHLDEIEELERLAEELGRTIQVGIRLNLDAGIYPQWSRFGFNVESGQAMDAVRGMHERGRLRVHGLHCHIGTFICDPTAYARQIAKMVAFGYEIQERFAAEIDYIDIGGGFPSRSRLKGSYLSPDVGLLSLDEYAEHICEALNHALRPGDRPRLILESGRAMVDEAGYLITSVVASKFLPDGTRSYVVDTGIDQLFTSFWYKFNVEIDREVPGSCETSVVYGSACMNIDVLDEGVQLPPLERGHRLIFSPVGAYNNTQWMQFIHYRPNIVMVGESGEVDIIREREDLTDIERRECLPGRLSLEQ